MKVPSTALLCLAAAFAAAQMDSAGFFGSAKVGAGFDQGKGSKGAGDSAVLKGVSVVERDPSPEIAGDCAKHGISPSDTISVLLLGRPLTADVGGRLQSATKGIASHVQIGAYSGDAENVCLDVGNANPFDNFGFTGAKASLSPVDSAILVEKSGDIARKYSPEPLGVFQMSAAAYFRTRNAAFALADQANYASLNKVDLDKAVKIGLLAGGVVGSVTGNAFQGLVDGGKSGVAYAFSEYERDGRRNPGMADKPDRMMSFPEYNCQYFALLFLLLAQSEPSFKVVKPYRMPGESETEESVLLATDNAPSGKIADEDDPTGKGELAEILPVEGVPDGGTPAPEASKTDEDLSSLAPQAVVTAFFEALRNLDEDRARALATPESGKAIELALVGFVFDHEARENFHCTVGDCRIDGDAAEVETFSRNRLDGVAESATARIPLKKLGGAWKVAFTADLLSFE